MTSLEKAKKIIEINYKFAAHGIFNTRNTVGDSMTTIYADEELQIDMCYTYEYFEVFGLSWKDFAELEEFYKSLVKGD